MSEDTDFQLRIGRIRSRGASPRTFVAVALAAAQKAGGLARSGSRRAGSFGAGRPASLSAERGVGRWARRVVVKARVVRHRGPGAPLATHIDYLQREGVDPDGRRARVFGAEGQADGRAFAERCADDRHHFRFIVSPEDAEQLTDLRAYARDLVRQMETDLGTRLDWVAVDHWNTGQPHLHVLVRGRTDRGEDLVIAPDYISQGLRARAQALATLELGPRTEQDIDRSLKAEVEADRWTALDRRIAGRTRDGVVDLRGARDEPQGVAQVRRLQKLTDMGLATPAGHGRWRLAADAEPTLRALGRQGDVIARLHRAMSGEARAHDPASYVTDPPATERPVVGRLVARGLDDELSGSAYAVVDAVDGRAHHIALRDLDDASDAPSGAIVELREREGPGGRRRWGLAVRSDLALGEQVTAPGATWLDRQLVGRTPAALADTGFGGEVRHALRARLDHLEAAGLARRQGRQVTFARDLLATLRARELAAASGRITAETGLGPLAQREGDIAGVYRRRLALASGRFAMIEGTMGFALVPWRPELEANLGRHVEGRAGPDGRITWSFTRTRGLGR